LDKGIAGLLDNGIAGFRIVFIGILASIAVMVCYVVDASRDWSRLGFLGAVLRA
jgi:hypothetical protein